MDEPSILMKMMYKRETRSVNNFRNGYIITAIPITEAPLITSSAILTTLSSGLPPQLLGVLFSMVPETLPPRRASIGLGLVNGMGTVGFSIFAPLYGYFVDVTGTYSVSNQIIQFLILLMPVIFYLFIKE